MLRLEVKLPSAGYPVIIDHDSGAEQRLADELAARVSAPVGLVTDETVARLHGPRIVWALRQKGLQVVEAVVPDGESSKSMARAETVAEAFARGGLTRKSLVVALGGGVAGDLGGFCAATWKRGIDFVQVPTTLLAMTDAAIGGKVGVDFQGVKNVLGAFRQPSAVFIDPASA